VQDRLAERLPWVVLPLAAAVGLVAAQSQRSTGRSPAYVAIETAAGWALVGAGLAVRRRRPGNRCWWLITTAGLAWFIGRLEAGLGDHAGEMAFALNRAYEVFLVWALLAYPTGRLAGRVASALLGAVVAANAGRALSRLLLYVPPDVAGYGTRNRYLPVTDARWWTAVEDGFPIVRIVLSALVLALVADRWWRSSTPGRRTMTPGLVAASLLMAAVAFEDLLGWYTLVPGTELRLTLVRFTLVGITGLTLAYGLHRLRTTRSAVIDVVGDLAHDVPQQDLEAALARSLGDPSLRLGVWSSEHGAYRDVRGHTIHVQPASPARAVTLIRRGTESLATLEHDAVLLEDPALVNAIATTIRLTTDNERMRGELQARLDELARSRARIVEAGDAERRRIERDLHDGAQQRLVTLGIGLRLAEASAAAGEIGATRSALGRAVSDLGEAIEELRNLARGLHPAVLTESGLAAALESLADRAGLPTRLHVQLDHEPSSSAAAAIYFTAAEALTNAARHATATRADVDVRCDRGIVRLVVADDGQGGADPERGSGLRGIQDRVAAANGTLAVTSVSGNGTRIEASVPCGS